MRSSVLTRFKNIFSHIVSYKMPRSIINKYIETMLLKHRETFLADCSGPNVSRSVCCWPILQQSRGRKWRRSLRHAQRKAFLLHFRDKPLSLSLCLPIMNHRRKWGSSWFFFYRFFLFPSAVVGNLSNRSGACFFDSRRPRSTLASAPGYTCCKHVRPSNDFSTIARRY